MSEQKKKGPGGTLNRSEIVQTRLSPKVRFMAEVLARQQKRTLSSLIECLLDEAAENHSLAVLINEHAQDQHYLLGDRKYKRLPLKKAIDMIWSVDEAERFAGVALFLPELLTAEEERLWMLILNTAYFWEHFEYNIETPQGKIVKTDWWPIVNHCGLIREHLREHWALLNAIIGGKASETKLKKLTEIVGRVVPKPKTHISIKKVVPDGYKV